MGICSSSKYVSTHTNSISKFGTFFREDFPTRDGGKFTGTVSKRKNRPHSGYVEYPDGRCVYSRHWKNGKPKSTCFESSPAGVYIGKMNNNCAYEGNGIFYNQFEYIAGKFRNHALHGYGENYIRKKKKYFRGIFVQGQSVGEYLKCNGDLVDWLASLGMKKYSMSFLGKGFHSKSDFFGFTKKRFIEIGVILNENDITTMLISLYNMNRNEFKQLEKLFVMQQKRKKREFKDVVVICQV